MYVCDRWRIPGTDGEKNRYRDMASIYRESQREAHHVQRGQSINTTRPERNDMIKSRKPLLLLTCHPRRVGRAPEQHLPTVR